MIRSLTYALLVLACLLSACGSKPLSPELLDARAAYDKAREGPASTIDPAGMFEAHKALEQAEKKQKEKPGSTSARDAAYIALRKTQLSEVNAENTAAATCEPRQK